MHFTLSWPKPFLLNMSALQANMQTDIRLLSHLTFPPFSPFSSLPLHFCKQTIGFKSGHLLLLNQNCIIRYYMHIHTAYILPCHLFLVHANIHLPAWLCLSIHTQRHLKTFRALFQRMYRPGLMLLFCVLLANAHTAGFMELTTVKTCPLYTECNGCTHQAF